MRRNAARQAPDADSSLAAYTIIRARTPIAISEYSNRVSRGSAARHTVDMRKAGRIEKALDIFK